MTNRNQTETICEALRDGGTFESALRTRSYEPDAPHLTPRISGMLSLGREGGPFVYRLSILKAKEKFGCKLLTNRANLLRLKQKDFWRGLFNTNTTIWTS